MDYLAAEHEARRAKGGMWRGTFVKLEVAHYYRRGAHAGTRLGYARQRKPATFDCVGDFGVPKQARLTIRRPRSASRAGPTGRNGLATNHVFGSAIEKHFHNGQWGK
jgi:hypothetical protein